MFGIGTQVKTKSAIEKFIELDGKFAEQLRSVKEHPKLTALRAMLVELKGELAEVEKKITGHYEGISSSCPIASTEADAQAILAGMKASELPGQSADTIKQNFIRQRDGLRKAIGILEQQIPELNLRLAREGCEEFRAWYFDKQIKPEIDACECLCKILQEKKIRDEGLSCKGYMRNCRLPGFDVTTYEEFLIFGGQNFQSLRSHIDFLRKLWGLDSKK